MFFTLYRIVMNYTIKLYYKIIHTTVTLFLNISDYKNSLTSYLDTYIYRNTFWIKSVNQKYAHNLVFPHF